MNTKMLVFDLDGTLLNSQTVIDSPEREIISEYSRRGVKISYITARSPRAVTEILKDMPCDGISYYNGAMTYCDDKLIDANLIKYADGIKIYNIFKDKDISVYIEPYSYRKGTILNLDTKEVTDGTIYDIPENDIQRVRIIAKNLEIDLPEYLTVTTTRDDYALILNKNAKKEKALREIAKYYNLEMQDITAFGDDLNDMNMIKEAGIGIAMGNAVDELKSVADCVIDTNDNNGIYKFLNDNRMM